MHIKTLKIAVNVVLAIVSLAIIFVVMKTMSGDQSEQKVSYIISTDMSENDIIALLYLLKNHNITLAGILVDEDPSYRKTQLLRMLLHVTHHTNVPVISVRNQTREATNKAETQQASPDDKITTNSEPDPSQDQYLLYIRELITKLFPNLDSEIINQIDNNLDQFIEQLTGKIVYVNLGRMTIFSKIVKNHPGFVKQIKYITLNEGSDSVSPSQPSENYFIQDPSAIKALLQYNVPITLVTSSVIHKARVTLKYVSAVEEQNTTPETQIVLAIFNQNLNLIQDSQFFLSDTLAAFIATKLGYFHVKEKKIDIITESGSHTGQIIEQANGKLVSEVSEIPTNYLEDDLLQKLNYKETKVSN